jgi:hypothetical protein
VSDGRWLVEIALACGQHIYRGRWAVDVAAVFSMGSAGTERWL